MREIKNYIYDQISKENRSVFRDVMVISFQMYTSSKQWKNVKDQLYKKYNMICQDCHKKIIENSICHHLSYENWGKGNYEEVLDCILLCQKCHSKRHRHPSNEDSPSPFWTSRYYWSQIIYDQSELLLPEI